MIILPLIRWKKISSQKIPLSTTGKYPAFFLDIPGNIPIYKEFRYLTLKGTLLSHREALKYLPFLCIHVRYCFPLLSCLFCKLMSVQVYGSKCMEASDSQKA